MKALVGAVAIVLLAVRPALADDGGPAVSPETGGFTAGLTQQYAGSADPDRIGGTGPSAPVVDLGTDLVEGFCSGINWSDTCEPEPETVVVEEPTVTPGRVLRAFQRIPLPPARLEIQPPNGRTLVNFETNFFTRQGNFTRAVTLLGQRVELRIRPAAFVWHYGDGSTEQTSSPGAAYPDLEITHEYARTGWVAPRLDTTYAADFRVGGGGWQPVAGTVTIPGPAQRLRVVEARPVLVGR